MTRLLVFVAVLSFLAVPLTVDAAQKSRDTKKDLPQDEYRPGASEIRKKAERATYRKKDTVTHTFHDDKIARFTPADIPSDASDPEFLEGVVLGRLVTHRVGLADDLPEGTYVVYLRKAGNKWHVYYTDENGHIEQRAGETTYDKEKDYTPPSFRDLGKAIGYSHWKFSF